MTLPVWATSNAATATKGVMNLCYPSFRPFHVSKPGKTKSKSRAEEIVFGLLLIALLGYWKWCTTLMYLPGQWGNAHGFMTINILVASALCLFGLGRHWIKRRAWVLIGAFVALIGVVLLVPLSSKDRRIREEFPLMKADPAYGRSVVKTQKGWRVRFYIWFSTGIDDHVGIMRDPTRKVRKGIVSPFGPVTTAEEIEPGWYFVKTT